MDSHDKRQQLIDDILHEIKNLFINRSRSAKGSKSRAFEFLNSAFVVTLLGGIAITIVTLLFQHYSAKSAREISYQRQRFQHKENLFVEFSKDFLTSLNLAERYKLREIWLRKNRNKQDKGLVSPEGRTFEEMRNKYEELLDRYLKVRDSDSFCAQIRATYDSESVIKKVDSLSNNMDKLIGARDNKSVKEMYDKSGMIYQELIIEMGKELKRK